ncbi:hypothetical protein Tco_0917452 [Tanacetum coccineum]
MNTKVKMITPWDEDGEVKKNGIKDEHSDGEIVHESLFEDGELENNHVDGYGFKWKVPSKFVRTHWNYKEGKKVIDEFSILNIQGLAKKAKKDGKDLIALEIRGEKVDVNGKEYDEYW